MLKQKNNIIWSDAEGYFMYLPAWFVYGNYSDQEIYTPVLKKKQKTGNFYTKYTMGVALLEAPFFIYKDIIERKIRGRDASKLKWAHNKYGIIRFFNIHRSNSFLILLVFSIITWIFAIWWFGGAYGHKYYVEYYTILVLPMVWVYGLVYKSKYRLSQILLSVVICIMIFYSYGLTTIYNHPWAGKNSVKKSCKYSNSIKNMKC